MTVDAADTQGAHGGVIRGDEPGLPALLKKLTGRRPTQVTITDQEQPMNNQSPRLRLVSVGDPDYRPVIVIDRAPQIEIERSDWSDWAFGVMVFPFEIEVAE